MVCSCAYVCMRAYSEHTGWVCAGVCVYRKQPAFVHVSVSVRIDSSAVCAHEVHSKYSVPVCVCIDKYM